MQAKSISGPGPQGKGSGTGAKTDIRDEKVEPNMVLSNRDKSQHSKTRGQDSKRIQSEQLQDASVNQSSDYSETSK